jgi:hypothetical protein
MELTLREGKPYLRFICAGCGHAEFCDWRRLKPGVSLTCCRCGRRVVLTRRMFTRVRNMLESGLRTVSWETSHALHPRLWVP